MKYEIKAELLYQIIAKQDELIMELLIQALDVPSSPEERLLRKKISELKSRLKEQQCHAIYEKVKESWTPDKRSFEEAESESRLKDKPESANFMQIRDLTDEEWMKLPKEEILQLYKNCYSMLRNYIKLSGEKVSDVSTFTTTDFKENTQDKAEEILAEKYELTKEDIDSAIECYINGKDETFARQRLRSELIKFLSESIIELPEGKDCIDLVDEYLKDN